MVGVLGVCCCVGVMVVVSVIVVVIVGRRQQGGFGEMLRRIRMRMRSRRRRGRRGVFGSGELLDMEYDMKGREMNPIRIEEELKFIDR